MNKHIVIIPHSMMPCQAYSLKYMCSWKNSILQINKCTQFNNRSINKVYHENNSAAILHLIYLLTLVPSCFADCMCYEVQNSTFNLIYLTGNRIKSTLIPLIRNILNIVTGTLLKPYSTFM